MTPDLSLLDDLRSLLDYTEAAGLTEAHDVLRGLLVDMARAVSPGGAPARPLAASGRAALRSWPMRSAKPQRAENLSMPPDPARAAAGNVHFLPR